MVLCLLFTFLALAHEVQSIGGVWSPKDEPPSSSSSDSLSITPTTPVSATQSQSASSLTTRSSSGSETQTQSNSATHTSSPSQTGSPSHSTTSSGSSSSTHSASVSKSSSMTTSLSQSEQASSASSASTTTSPLSSASASPSVSQSHSGSSSLSASASGSAQTVSETITFSRSETTTLSRSETITLSRSASSSLSSTESVQPLSQSASQTISSSFSQTISHSGSRSPLLSIPGTPSSSLSATESPHPDPSTLARLGGNVQFFNSNNLDDFTLRQGLRLALSAVAQVPFSFVRITRLVESSLHFVRAQFVIITPPLNETHAIATRILNTTALQTALEKEGVLVEHLTVETDILVVSGSATPSPSVAPPDHPRDKKRRRILWIVLIAGAVLAAVIALPFVIWFCTKKTQKPRTRVLAKNEDPWSGLLKKSRDVEMGENTYEKIFRAAK